MSSYEYQRELGLRAEEALARDRQTVRELAIGLVGFAIGIVMVALIL